MRQTAWLLMCSLVLAACASTPPGAADRAETTGWQDIAASPLSPRDNTVSTWTGTELLVVGGADFPSCPAGAGCVGPTADQVLRDGAAYDPATDTWRELPEAPTPMVFARSSWTGRDMVVVSPSVTNGPGRAIQEATTLALDPDAQAWRTLDPPPEPHLIGGLWTGRQLLYWQSEETPRGSDWLLDPIEGTWTTVPPDPFGETFDRSYGWTGSELILAALPLDEVDQDGQPHFQTATLDLATGSWSAPEASPVTFWAVEWFVFDGAFVNPSQDVTNPEGGDISGAMDIDTGEWRDVPQLSSYDELKAGCPLPTLGPAGDWLAAGGSALISLDPADAMVVPACPPLEAVAAAAWTGEQVVVWGGRIGDQGRTSGVGFAWTPPHPTN